MVSLPRVHRQLKPAEATAGHLAHNVLMKTFPSAVKLLLICDGGDLILPAVLLVLRDEAKSIEEGVRGGLLLLPAPRPAALYTWCHQTVSL